MAIPLESQQKAIEMRQQGLAIKVIGRALKFSPSTILKYVKHIELTSEQKAQILSSKNKEKLLSASKLMQQKYKDMRDLSREEGRVKAKEGDIDHAMACCLYWAEGSKSRNSLKFSNTDPQMIKLFYNFLVKNFDKAPQFYFVYHENCQETINNSTLFWSNLLGLRPEEVRSNMNMDMRIRSGRKTKKHIYGAGHLVLNSTHATQHVYGALEVYGGTIIKED